jgi:hypothetical protein
VWQNWQENSRKVKCCAIYELGKPAVWFGMGQTDGAWCPCALARDEGRIVGAVLEKEIQPSPKVPLSFCQRRSVAPASLASLSNVLSPSFGHLGFAIILIFIHADKVTRPMA